MDSSPAQSKAQETVVSLDTGFPDEPTDQAGRASHQTTATKQEVRFSNFSVHTAASHDMQMKALFTRPNGPAMFGLGKDKGLQKAFSSAMHNVGQKDVIDRNSRFSFLQVFKLTSLEFSMLKSFSVTSVVVAAILVKVLEMHDVVDLKDYMWLAENKSVLSTIGLFLSFFLTYFLGQCVSRYYNMYFTGQAIVGRCYNTILLSASYLDEEKVDRMWRFVNVAHMALYKEILKKSGCGDNWWRGICLPRISQYQLLSEEEVQIVCPPKCVPSGMRIMRFMMLWCEQTVAKAVSEDALHGELAAKFHTELREFRGASADMGDIFDRPLPMMYLTVVLKTVYVYFIFTVLFATLSDKLFDCCLVIVFSAYQLFGLLIIARAMESPFGVEEDDLPIIDYVDSVLEETLEMISLQSVPEDVASDAGASPMGKSLSGMSHAATHKSKAYNKVSAKKAALCFDISPKSGAEIVTVASGGSSVGNSKGRVQFDEA